MFILYAVLIGVIAALILGGRPSGLAKLRLHWEWLMVGGLVTQIVLFSGPVTEVIGPAGPPIYVGSTAVVITAVLRNWRVTGMAVVALGALCNLAAILANGGYMPASPEAMAALHKLAATNYYSNSALLAAPQLVPLTDIFALPAWLPFANVFSIGDLIIGIGVALVIVAAMVRRFDSSVLAARAGEARG
jgi:hypothetical protein